MTTPTQLAEREVRLGLAETVEESLFYQAYVKATGGRSETERVVEVSGDELAELERGVQRAQQLEAADARLFAAAQEEARAREARELATEDQLYRNLVAMVNVPEAPTFEELGAAHERASQLRDEAVAALEAAEAAAAEATRDLAGDLGLGRITADAYEDAKRAAESEVVEALAVVERSEAAVEALRSKAAEAAAREGGEAVRVAEETRAALQERVAGLEAAVADARRKLLAAEERVTVVRDQASRLGEDFVPAVRQAQLRHERASESNVVGWWARTYPNTPERWPVPLRARITKHVEGLRTEAEQARRDLERRSRESLTAAGLAGLIP